VLFSEQNVQSWVHYFQRTTSTLINEKSVNRVGSTFKYVDIVKDVVNLVPVYWLADEIVSRYLGLNASSDRIFLSSALR